MSAITSGRRAVLSEFGVVGLLAGLGVLVLIGTQDINESLASSRTLGPRVAPYFVGTMLLVVAVLLAVDVLRGGRGEQESGEDVDLSHGTDWKILAGLALIVVAAGQLIPFIGFPAAGALLFFGVVRVLGSRRLWLDLLVSIGLSGLSFLLFSELLGISLPLVGE